MFSHTLPADFTPLLLAAEHAWEAVANITFVNTGDHGTNSVTAADIRVGLAILSPLGFIGYTRYGWNENNKFTPGSVVTIDDPVDHGVTRFADGNFGYVGFQATVFQDLLHELGHAVGLAHNPGDPTAIMNPLLGSGNQYVDAQDAAALRALYGPATVGAVATSRADTTLSALIPRGSTIIA